MGTRTHWGRSRFGGTTAILIAISLTAGVLLALGSGALAMALQQGGNRPWLLFGLTALFTLPVWAAGVWAILVDRTTLTDAPDDPEASVEGAWINTASSNTFHILLAALGLGAVVFAYLPAKVDTSLVLMGYTLLAMVTFAINYMTIKRANR